MPRWNGGVIGAANNPTSSSAKGIWSLSEATKAIRAGLWPPSNAGADPYFENVTLLLPGDGTNGAQNNTFLDSSTNNFTITRNGNTTQGTFSPFSKVDGRWGNYFDGSGDYLSAASNTALDCGTGNFTIEAWVYITSRTLNYPAIFSNNNGTYSAGALALTNSNSDNASYNDKFVLACYDDTVGAPALVASSTNDKFTWYHVALVRNGTALTMYRNGVSVASKTISASLTFNWGKSGFLVGGGNWDGAQSYFNGYISNARLVKGTAVYTGAFTPSTAPLTAITNTSLLTCQSNRFIDNSTNAFAITRNGDVAVTTFSPFPSLTAYAAGTNGGSGYFDGTGDYLTAPSNSAFNIGTGDFTIEGWVYLPTAGSAGYGIVSISGYELFVRGSANGTTATWYNGSSVVASSASAVPSNSWNHIAVTRTGTTLRVYLNGVSGTSATNSDSVGATATCYVGVYSNGSSDIFYGYLSDVRIVKGTAVYTGATLTVPTAPLTAVSGTSLLLSGTNGGIIDTSMSNDLETVGNAQISTTQSKFGGASMYFDGTGDYLVFPNSQNFALGSGDFTVEAWVYVSASKIQAIMDTRAVNSNTTGIALAIDASNYPYVYVNNSTLFTSSTAISLSTWTHLAMVRSGGTITLYINGVKPSTGSGSNSTNLTDTALTVASVIDYRDTSATLHFNGYIDDLRITKGYARYTTNFTAPVGPFNGFGD